MPRRSPFMRSDTEITGHRVLELAILKECSSVQSRRDASKRAKEHLTSANARCLPVFTANRNRISMKCKCSALRIGLDELHFVRSGSEYCSSAVVARKGCYEKTASSGVRTPTARREKGTDLCMNR